MPKNEKDQPLTWVERTRLELSKTEEGRSALADAEARREREVERICSAGYCVEFYDPTTDEVTGGWGPVGCACQDEQAIPPVKAETA